MIKNYDKSAKMNYNKIGLMIFPTKLKGFSGLVAQDQEKLMCYWT